MKEFPNGGVVLQDDEDMYDPTSQMFSKEASSFKEIILKAIEKCRIEWSKDYRRGGTYNVQTKNGVLPVYFPDQREIDMNVTENLNDLLLFYFDDKCEKNIGDIRERMKESKGVYLQEQKDYRTQALSSSKNPRSVNYDSADNKAYADYVHRLTNLYREMFRELILLFKRENELSSRHTALN